MTVLAFSGHSRSTAWPQTRSQALRLLPARNLAGASFPVSVSETSRAVYAYAAPEVRASYAIGEHLEITASLALLVLGALDQPTWIDRQPVLAAPSGQQGDGVATFGAQSLAGPFLLVALPSLGARWAF